MEGVLAGLRGGMAGLAAQMVMQAALTQPHAAAALKVNMERYARVRLGVSKVLAKVPAVSCVGGGGGGCGGGGGTLSRRAHAGSGGSAGSDASAAYAGHAGHAGLFLAVDVSALGLSAKEVSMSLRLSLRLSLLSPYSPYVCVRE